MKEQVKELRVKIDGLAQLVKSLKPITIDRAANHEESSKYWKENPNYDLQPVFTFDDKNLSKEASKAYDSLMLAKAWLGKVLEELGADNPYGTGYKTKEDIHPAADVADLKSLYAIAKYRAFKDIECYVQYGNNHNELVSIAKELGEQYSVVINDCRFFIKQEKEYVFTKSRSFNDTETVKVLGKNLSKSELKLVYAEWLKNNNITNNSYELLNHIEKVYWLRQEIEKVIYSLENIEGYIDSSVNTAPSCKLERYTNQSLYHLMESRFNLGFELERIKNN